MPKPPEKPKAKGKPGRPKLEATKKRLERITALAGIGLGLERIAEILGVSETALRKYEVFMAAFRRGLATGEEEALKDLRTMRKAGNYQAVALWLRAHSSQKEKYREKIEHSNDPKNPLEPTKVIITKTVHVKAIDKKGRPDEPAD